MTIEVVQAIILRGAPGHEKVLVVKERRGRSRKLPGGAVQSGENYIAALRRELGEELSGIDWNGVRVAGPPIIDRVYNRRIGEEVVLRRYRVQIPENSNPRPNKRYGEINNITWLPKSEWEPRGFYGPLPPRKRRY